MKIKSSPDFMMDCIRKIHETDRWFSSDKMMRTCRTVEAIMKDIGMKDVKTITYPSDGKTDYGGWVMPLCWDAKEAILEIVAPKVKEKILCRYSLIPCSLMLNSRPVDITAEVVLADEYRDVSPKGKIVLITGKNPGLEKTIEWFTRGAEGIICSALGGSHYGKKGFEYLRDVRQWHNYTVPHWQIKGNPFGFSISPAQGKHLSSLIRKNGKVILRACVKTRLYSGRLPMVTGCLKGLTSEEIVVTGHLFEQGANDNASGIALALGIVKALENKKLKRGVRLLFTYEVRSIQAYLQNTVSLEQIVAGINLDMVGVTNNKAITIGGNRPVFPNYSVPLLQSILSKHPEYTAKESDFSAMDNAFGEPQLGIPMPYIMLGDDPNYHKSSDIPDSISPDVLNLIGDVSGQYVTFLCNARYREARRLAQIVYNQERNRLREMPGKSDFVIDMAKQSLESVRKLMRIAGKSDSEKIHSKQKKDLNRFIKYLQDKLDAQFKEKAAVQEPVIQDVEMLKGLVPRKLFRGFFSFEKYLGRKNEFKSIQELIHGWNAAPWVNYALMWSDGKRTGLDIYKLLIASRKFTGQPKQLIVLLEFMEKEGYLHLPVKNRKQRKNVHGHFIG